MEKDHDTMHTIETASGATVSATIKAGFGGIRRVEISQDGAFVGAGVWAGAQIVDCSAVLGAPDGSESEATFEALDAALRAA